MTDAPQPELLPCPFCGGAPFFDNLSPSGTGKYDFYIRCTVCEVQQIAEHTRGQAIALWNRRSVPGDVRGKALEEAAKVAEGYRDSMAGSQYEFGKHDAATKIARDIRALSHTNPIGKKE